MNPQRDRGIRAEREACAILHKLLGASVRRRANEGIREDIGDLIGLPDTTIQISAVPDSTTKIADRATRKTVDVEKQRARAGDTHAVVLLRIDGGHWRAVCTTPQLHRLKVDLADAAVYINPPAPGATIRWAPMFSCRDWSLAGGLWVATIDGWARTWQQTVAAR